MTSQPSAPRALCPETARASAQAAQQDQRAGAGRNAPRRIAVDLTPVQPGGENGGARLFVVELLSQLADLAPRTQFILLTQATSHADLAVLDGPNVERRLVIGQQVSQRWRPRLIALTAWLMSHLPERGRRALGALAYQGYAALKRLGRGRLLTELDADLLYCPFTAPTYHQPGIPTVCTLYDLQYLAFPDFFSAEDRANRAGTFAAACRQADLIVAISRYAQSAAITHGRLARSRTRAIPIRMANRLRGAQRAASAISDALRLADGRYLLYPANFWLHKNHARLLTAFADARARGLPGDIVLVCTGAPGQRLESVRGQAARLGLTAWVRFPGYVAEPDLAALLDHAGGLIFPSLHEGFGLPVIEAMAAGIPVACSAVAALPEIAADAAILFDPTDPEGIAAAMLQLMLDHDARARLIRAGIGRAAHFADSRAMAREYWESFCTLTGRTD